MSPDRDLGRTRSNPVRGPTDFRPREAPQFTGFLRLRHRHPLRDKAVTPFAMAKYQPEAPSARMADLETVGFPQFFPQVWKSLGGNPNERPPLCPRTAQGRPITV